MKIPINPTRNQRRKGFSHAVVYNSNSRNDSKLEAWRFEFPRLLCCPCIGDLSHWWGYEKSKTILTMDAIVACEIVRQWNIPVPEIYEDI